MIDWLTVVIALVIITSLVGIFGYFAWKISESDTFLFGGPTPDSVDSPVLEKKKAHDQTKKKRKEQKKPKRETKDGEAKQQNQSEETDEESEQDSSSTQQTNVPEFTSKARKRQKNKPTVVVTERTENTTERQAPTTQPKPLPKGKTQVKVANPTKPAAKPSGAASVVSHEENLDEEQPFTVVGPTRNKNSSTTKPNVVSTSSVPVEPLPPRPMTTTTQANGTSTPTPPPPAPPTTTTKSTKTVVSDLMSALDTFVLSAEELELIGHKIANKQSILKQDWSKLTPKPKTDDEAQNEKRRLTDLLKEKERQIETLQSQLNSAVQQRTVETPSTGAEKNQVQQRVMQEQICKLSVQNGELEKKIKRLETLVDEKESEKANLCQRLKDLENENEQLKREDIVHVEPPNDELEKLHKEISDVKNAAKRNEENQRHRLVEVLPENLRGEVAHDDQWVSSYRNVLGTHFESTKRQVEEQIDALRKENEKLRHNMTEVENQLKDIEQVVQSKEDLLILELKNRDEKVANILNENETLTGELIRLRAEFERVQSAYETSLSDVRALKVQLDERFLVAANTPPVATDESFELIKQSPPSSSPIVIDMRAEQLNELIRSSKEALENQDSIAEQLDRHLDDMHRASGAGETSTSNVDPSNATSSNQQ